MENEFAKYKQALRLQKLGFDEPCFGFYIAGQLMVTTDSVYNSTDIPVLKAPTFSQAFRWFREKYGLVFNLVGSGPYYPSIALTYVDGDSDIELYEFDTYEEAELACLDKLIEIVENKSE